MGTRSIIARGNKDGFRGRYCHWDGYPTYQGPQGDPIATVFLEAATLSDTRGRWHYVRGAQRVRVVAPTSLRDKPRTRTFKGESAWSQAESYLRDVVSNLQAREMEDA